MLNALGLLLLALLLGTAILWGDWLQMQQAKRRLLRSGVVDLDRMSGREFEAFLAALFADQGFAVRRIGRTGDFGGDLLLRRGRETAVVQAKRYRGRVGVRAIQEAVAAKGYYRCQRAWVATNSRFTPAAKELARANGVELIDRDRLARLMAGSKAGLPPR